MTAMSGGDDLPSQTRSRLPEFFLLLAFACSRIAIYAAGLRYTDAALRVESWQLLDPRILKTDLLSGVWHLHSQPPLYNLFSGLLLKLPVGLGTAITVAIWIGLGLCVVMAAFWLLVELSVPVWVSFAVVFVSVLASPAYWGYENGYSYTYPTVALLTVGSLSLLRFLRSDRKGLGALTFLCFALIILINSHYQLVWLVLVLVAVILPLRSHWRIVCTVAAVPVLVVLFVYAKDFVMFGTTTTSSWLGMNLAKGTINKAPESELKQLVDQGTLTPIAQVRIFSPPADYVPFVGPLSKTGTPALDEGDKSTWNTNFNNLIYVRVSKAYLHDDLAFIMARPGAYGHSVLLASELWLTPADEAFLASPTWPPVADYARVYDRFVMWQPTFDRNSTDIALTTNDTIPASQLSYLILLVYLVSLIGLPVLAWRRRSTDPPLAAFAGAMWVTVGYGFVVTTLTELGENLRFEFELGPLPIVSAVLIITTMARALNSRRPSSRCQPSQVAPGRVEEGTSGPDGISEFDGIDIS
jgi:hypothetical protein